MWRRFALAPATLQTIVTTNAMKAVDPETVPDSFWRQPPIWWKPARSPATQVYTTPGFNFEGRSGDGDHYVLDRRPRPPGRSTCTSEPTSDRRSDICTNIDGITCFRGGASFAARRVICCLACLVVSVAVGVGTIGYHAAGRLAWLDSFLNASMILSGMGPVDQDGASPAESCSPRSTRSSAASSSSA